MAGMFFIWLPAAAAQQTERANAPSRSFAKPSAQDLLAPPPAATMPCGEENADSCSDSAKPSPEAFLRAQRLRLELEQSSAAHAVSSGRGTASPPAAAAPPPVPVYLPHTPPLRRGAMAAVALVLAGAVLFAVLFKRKK